MGVYTHYVLSSVVVARCVMTFWFTTSVNILLLSSALVNRCNLIQVIVEDGNSDLLLTLTVSTWPCDKIVMIVLEKRRVSCKT